MRRLAYLTFLLAACGDDKGVTPDARTPDAAEMVDAPLGPTVAVTIPNRPTIPSSYSFTVIYRDGTGQWKAAPDPVNGTYTLPVASATYGVAWTCLSPTLNLREVNLYYFTKAERPTLALQLPDYCTDQTTSLVALSGTVANRPVGAVAAAFGRFSGDVQDNGTYTIMTTPGTHDLVVGHLVIASGNAVADTAGVSRNVAVNGAATANFDYANAMATQTAAVTVTSPGSVQVRTTLYTAGGTRFRMSDMTSGGFVAVGLATALAQSGDVYNTQIRTIQSGSTLLTQDWKSTVSATTFTAPAALGTVMTTVAASTPYPRLKWTWSPYATTVGYQVAATQSQTPQQCGSGPACTVTWNASVSPGAAGTMPQFEMPDFSTLPGWIVGLELKAGTPVTGFVSASTSSVGPSDFPLTATAPAGARRTLAATDFSITP